MASERLAIFVVGPGRCGSSCMMGVLQILGIYIGDDFSMPYEGNLKGEFENIELRNINYQITKKITNNEIMFSLPLIDWKNYNNREDDKDMIKEKIQQIFGSHNVFAFKDPRLSFLLPLYLQASTELGYKNKIIVMSRETEEILESFMKGIEGIPKFQSYNREDINKYIIRNRISILQNIENYEHLFISYFDLLYDTKKVIEKINIFIELTSKFEDNEDRLNNFIDKKLKHF